MRHWNVCMGSMFKSKRHVDVFKKAKCCDYCSLWNVVFVHRYLMITLDQIQFGKSGFMVVLPT
jgi:hypothetical protein